MFFRTFIPLVLTYVLSSGAVLSHEFWISPERYSIKAGESIVADLRVGQKFDGSTLPYFPNSFVRFEVIFGDLAADVKSRLGDRPAMNMQVNAPGLAVVVHETTDSTLRYRSLEQFTNFLDKKDFVGVLAAHQARGLPDDGFVENYRRFAKALVAVGDGQGADRAVGLRMEIVALANPYTDDVSAGVPVLVMFEGAPRRVTQVQVFTRAPDGNVTENFMRTDGDGELLVPVQSGYEYLVDAVVMVQLSNDDAGAGAVWESLWAALTFKMP